MIRIQQLKIKPGHTHQQLLQKAAKTLKIKPDEIRDMQIAKRSVDARKKPDIWYSYVVDITLKAGNEEKCAARCKDKNVAVVQKKEDQFPAYGKLTLKHSPVIIGTGPAGLFCGYMLALHGYKPILIERGQAVEQRMQDVEHFWESGELNPESNVQFGEGGAGTFSDGKLNTLIKDKDGKNRKVLEIFTECGAQDEILYDAKPHIGTDVLTGVVRNMREKIISCGGQVRFGCRADGLLIEKDQITGVIVNGSEQIPTNHVILAIGHSARDTFAWLSKLNIEMLAKSFAVGFRVEHPQELIDIDQYGTTAREAKLSPAPYKVTAQTSNGRGVYSFCMCPGGYVVNASSEPGRLAVNGMSYSRRDSKNANSAIIVAVTPEDFGSDDPLAGLAFQRRMEQEAYQRALGKIPVQKYGLFAKAAGEETAVTRGKIGDGFTPCIKGMWQDADLTGILPAAAQKAFCEGMHHFGRLIPGFDDENTLLSGVESRTSSPVRISRDETMQTRIRGLYPCGEGAGYAGGITSAAMDGMRVAEEIASHYAPFEKK